MEMIIKNTSGVGLAILGGAAKGALASALTRGAGNQHSLEVQVISTNQRSRYSALTIGALTSALTRGALSSALTRGALASALTRGALASPLTRGALAAALTRGAGNQQVIFISTY